MTAGTPLLCCTDLSDTSRPALREAVRLADALQAPLIVLHVCPPPFPDPAYLSLALGDADLLEQAGEQARRTAQATLDAQVGDVRHALGLDRVPIRGRVRQGLVASTIVQEAELEDAELIVVGTHARAGLPRLLLGSVAERVVRTATRPVLTVSPACR